MSAMTVMRVTIATKCSSEGFVLGTVEPLLGVGQFRLKDTDVPPADISKAATEFIQLISSGNGQHCIEILTNEYDALGHHTKSPDYEYHFRLDLLKIDFQDLEITIEESFSLKGSHNNGFELRKL